MSRVTLKVIADRIRSGRGSGHGDQYLPWLWIRRKNPSHQGNQVFGVLPGYRRASHFLAAVEWYVALLCKYLGAADIREQLPLWPHAHPHTLSDLDVPHLDPWPGSIGLWEIARNAGIDHGLELGSDVPYVATLDLGVRLIEDSNHRFVGISLKPHEDLLQAEATDRIVERQELERRYLEEAGSHHTIVDHKLIGHDIPANLEIASSGARLPTRLHDTSRNFDFCTHLTEIGKDLSISVAIDQAGRKFGLPSIDADLLWRFGVWNRLIDIDISLPIVMAEPLGRSGAPIRRALRKELFGNEGSE